MTKTIDRTSFFQAIEEELGQSGADTSGLPQLLRQTSEAFKVYFENPFELTNALNIGALTFECAFLQSRTGKQEISVMVSTLIAEFRTARDRDSHAFFSAWVKTIPFTSEAIANMADVAFLQTSNAELESNVLAKSLFRDLGDLLEGSLQPLLRLRLQVFGSTE